MILAKSEDFADGLGLQVQIRTKLVRYWSFISSAVVRIGDDILELRGVGDHLSPGTEYWVNFEYQGKLESIGGFPVSLNVKSPIKRVLTIDLDSKYPGQKIVLSSMKEFVRVDFVNATAESFGKVVGMLGEFETGGPESEF